MREKLKRGVTIEFGSQSAGREIPAQIPQYREMLPTVIGPAGI
jgi:hypothetical protein